VKSTEALAVNRHTVITAICDDEMSRDERAAFRQCPSSAACYRRLNSLKCGTTVRKPSRPTLIGNLFDA
jgi:hypothetical protein